MATVDFRRVGLLTLAMVAVPVFWRFSLLSAEGLEPTAYDARGFVADAALGLLAAAGVGLLARVSRWLAALLAAVWSLLSWGAFEHVRALGSLPDVAHAGFLLEEGFLLGSVAHTTAAWGLIGTVAVAAVLAFRLPSEGARWIGGVAGVALLALLGLWAWPVSFAETRWRQTNVIEENVVTIVERVRAPGAVTSLTGEPTPAGSTGAGTDEDGRWLLPYEVAGRPNVLLLVLESVCGGHVRSIRRHHGLPADVELPFLDELCQGSIYDPNFIAQQRQTNRGLYALLAGDAPYLTTRTSKMTEYARSPSRECLPAVLERRGYASVYCQGAKLSSAVKRRFLEQSGFREVRGEVRAEGGPEDDDMRNGWGQNDSSFFRGVLERLAELDRATAPWFVTALTVGTHHPYTLVPDSFRTDVEDPQERSFLYADEVVRRFVQALRDQGLLENTLLVITADESVGLLKNDDSILTRLSRNWGLLIAVTPAGDRFALEAPHMQSDVAPSILDFVGLYEEARAFEGRSFFREYATPRPIAYGNCYSHTMGVFTPEGELLVHDERGRLKLRARTAPGALFRWAEVESGSDAGLLSGLAAAKNGRFEEAEALLEQATDADPENATAHYRLGWTRLKDGRSREALEDFGRAIAAWPEYADAHFARGVAHQDLGEWESALKAFDRVAELNTDRLGLHAARARSLCELGRHEEALAAYELSLQFKSEHPGSLRGRARCLAELGRAEPEPAAEAGANESGSPRR